MTEPSLLFVHSPLVGPSSWRRVADLAATAGADVVVADLTSVATTNKVRWRHYVDTAADAAAGIRGHITVVGHSGAGVLLPSIAARLGNRCSASVFVDAVVPAESGEHMTPPTLAAMLDEHTIDGLLTPWLTWWPDDVVEQLLPDPATRAVVLADMPRLPRDFYDPPVPLPHAWSSSPNGFVQLSTAYEEDHQRAVEREWPTTIIDGDHLSIVTSPDVVLRDIRSLVHELVG